MSDEDASTGEHSFLFGFPTMILLVVLAAPGVAVPSPVNTMMPAAGIGHTSVALCAADDELVDTHLGLNASANAIRQRLVRAGATPSKLDAPRSALVRDLAAALRVLASVPPSTRLDNITALRSSLEAKGEPYTATEGVAVLLERIEERLEKECFVVNARRPLAMSLALEDLQSAAAERMLTSSGSRIELLDRLYHFQQRCDRMVSTFTVGCSWGARVGMDGSKTLRLHIPLAADDLRHCHLPLRVLPLPSMPFGMPPHDSS